MSYRVTYGPEAEAQLVDLYRFIALKASPEIARSFTEAIVDHCDKLSEYPERGSPREDLRTGLRTIAFRRRVTIAYRVEPGTVTVLGIFYGGQDLDGILREGDQRPQAS